MTWTVSLPWPAKLLWPNRRAQHRYTGDLRTSAKNTAHWLTKEAKGAPCRGLDITFHPPGAGRRDLDNALAAIKSALDGIALAIGQDDSEWELTIRMGEPVRPDGCVTVEAING